MDTNERDEELAGQDLEPGGMDVAGTGGTGPESGEDLPTDPQTGQPVDPDPVDDANPDTDGVG